jgi:membrane protease YdiL (CAAX protease family)
MSNLHTRFPWIVSFGCAILFLALSIVGTPVGSQLEQWTHLPVNSGVLIQQLILAIFSALMVIAFGGWRKAGFFKTVSWRNLLIVLPLFIAPVILLFVAGIAATNPVQLIMLVIFTAMIGFAEEALCRGVMLGAFLPRGTLRAAIVSSLIFGSMHLI